MTAKATLMIPTNWDPELLPQLQGIEAAYLYGSLPSEATLRASLNLPAVSESEVADQVESAARRGIDFVYVMNATCMGNHELSEQGRREILQRLEWVSSVGGKGVVVANAFLLELVRTFFPDLEVHVSVLAEVKTPNAARFYEDLGADVIHLDPEVNRMFPKLGAIRRAVSCRLSVLTNEGCLLDCPMRTYHAQVTSHSRESIPGGYHFDYCYFQCSRMKVADPVHYLRMPWIRPEDLGVYEAAGIDHVKVAGREKMGDGPASHTDWIVRLAEAYYHGRSDNLADLLVAVDSVRPLFDEDDRQVGPAVHIDSSQLDGFVQFFVDGRCDMDCTRCSYCDDWAERAVRVTGDRDSYLAEVDDSIQSIRIGDFRTGKPVAP